MDQPIPNLSPTAAATILTLLKGIATDEGRVPLHDVHEQTISAIARHVLDTPVKIESLPAVFDDADTLTDAEQRSMTLHLGALLPLLEPVNVKWRTDALQRLADRWHIADSAVHDAIAVTKGHRVSLLVHQLRASRVELDSSILKQLWQTTRGVLHLDGDKHTLERFEGYAELPAGTLGRTLVDYYEDNDFGLPGTRGALFSNILTRHDLHHVLAGYDTTPLGEICVGFFDEALTGSDSYANYTVLLAAQFQFGVTLDPTVSTWQNQFDPEAAFSAFHRGRGVTVNYMAPGFETEPLMEQPLEEVRAQLGVPPGDRWTLGGGKWCGEMGPVEQRHGEDMLERAKLVL